MGWGLLLTPIYHTFGGRVNLFSPSPRWTATTHRVSGDRKAFGKSLCTSDRGPSTLSLGLRVWMVVKETENQAMPLRRSYSGRQERARATQLHAEPREWGSSFWEGFLKEGTLELGL